MRMSHGSFHKYENASQIWDFVANENESRTRIPDDSRHARKCQLTSHVTNARMRHKYENASQIWACVTNENTSRMGKRHEWEGVTNENTGRQQRLIGVPIDESHHKCENASQVWACVTNKNASRMRMSHEQEYRAAEEMYWSASWWVMSQMWECVTNIRMRHNYKNASRMRICHEWEYVTNENMSRMRICHDKNASRMGIPGDKRDVLKCQLRVFLWAGRVGPVCVCVYMCVCVCVCVRVKQRVRKKVSILGSLEDIYGSFAHIRALLRTYRAHLHILGLCCRYIGLICTY